MVRISRDFREMLGDDFVNGVRASDRYSPLESVVYAGWVTDDGATLLAEFRDSYFGERSAFADAGSYELAVNGRGIPDLDIEAVGKARVDALMRRGIAFAWDALYAAYALPCESALVARVSVAPILMDPDMYTGYVSFFSAKFSDRLGMGADSELDGFQVLMSGKDCATPLPD
ncbi:hypothetical protein ACWGH3_29685 [Streptomyces sp. NPDC054884]|uniref:hypothetical protein n=1 Tax=Streptomyces sp. B21-105 TaxID=3039417 RepID=UPI002FF22FBE